MVWTSQGKYDQCEGYHEVLIEVELSQKGQDDGGVEAVCWW